MVKYENQEKSQLVVMNASQNLSPAGKVVAISEHRRREIELVMNAVEQTAEQASAHILDNLRVEYSVIPFNP